MDMLGQLVTSQVKDADVLAISKVDAVSDEEAREAAERARQFNDRAEVIYLSTFNNQGIDRLVEIIQTWKE
jgi:G3E family GTPase